MGRRNGTGLSVQGSSTGLTDKRASGHAGVGSEPAPDGSGFQSTTVYHQWGSATLEAYDLFGKKLLEKQVMQGSGPVKLDVGHWPSGMVVFRLVFQNNMVPEEKLMVTR